MADEMDQLIADVTKDTTPDTPETKAPEKVSRKENFDDTEYENEEDESFDPENATPEQRKAWPKKYANALSRRDKAAVKYKADLSASQQKIAELEAKLAKQAPIDNKAATVAADKTQAVVEGKPDINQFKDYGEYVEALAEWKANLATAKAMQTAAEQRAKETETQQKAAASSANEQRIIKQAQELIQKNPEYLELVQSNADLLDALPPHVTEAFGELANPAVAFIALAKTDGALQALAKMTPTQAAAYLGKAEYIGMQQMGSEEQDNEAEDERPAPEVKRVSSAPAPMKSARSISSGKKPLDKMNADELFKELGIN
jgi:hypothetical protein